MAAIDLERVRRQVAELEPVALAAELVRLPSHPGVDRQEERVALALARWLAAHGIAAELAEAAPGRPNLLARVRAAAPGPTLLLCGHTDTVPLNAGDPGVGFSGEVRDGRLFGRGAVDMKGPLAAMAAALVVLRDLLPAGEVVLAAVADEEMESIGAEALVRSGLRADGAVVGEPTGNRLALGHKGLEWLEIELTGRAAHGGTPEQGINAIVAAARFVDLATVTLVPRFAERRHPLLGPPTLNFGTIHGGDQPSTVAASCRVGVDRRSVPGETYASMTGELAGLLAQIELGMPGLRSAIRRVPGGMATMEHVALATDPEAPVARAAARALAAVAGPSEATAFPAWTDGALLAGCGGIPTVVLGPGDLADAHSPRESIAVADIDQAAAIYAVTALELAAGEPA